MYYVVFCPTGRMLIEVILFSLVHHQMDYNKQLYRANEVQSLIFTHYKIKLGMKTAEEYAREILFNFLDNCEYSCIFLILGHRFSKHL